MILVTVAHSEQDSQLSKVHFVLQSSDCHLHHPLHSFGVGAHIAELLEKVIVLRGIISCTGSGAVTPVEVTPATPALETSLFT